MLTTTTAPQMATQAAAARVRVHGHGLWLAGQVSPSYATFVSTIDMSANGNGTCTKRPPRRLEKRLT